MQSSQPVHQLKVTQRSRHSSLSTRQSGAEKAVLGIQKAADGGTPGSWNGFLGHHFLLLIRFPRTWCLGKPEAGGQAAEGDRDAMQESQAEKLCLLFPASCLCTKPCAGVMPIPCAYGRPLEPRGLPLSSPCLGVYDCRLREQPPRPRMQGCLGF